jgi:hypothetical protein
VGHVHGVIEQVGGWAARCSWRIEIRGSGSELDCLVCCCKRGTEVECLTYYRPQIGTPAGKIELLAPVRIMT